MVIFFSEGLSFAFLNVKSLHNNFLENFMGTNSFIFSPLSLALSV